MDHTREVSNPFEHGREVDAASEEWLSVTEAVAYCAQHGLSRNIKTIRRWAERSFKRPESAEVKVREQDTGFGFRYMIERGSLDLKIKQELEFEANKKDTDASGQGQASPDTSAPALDENKLSIEEASLPDTPGHDQPGPDEPTRRLPVQSVGDDFLKDQISEKDTQIAQLNKQIERKDDQIMTMLERDRETNILIRGLQDALTSTLGLNAPPPRYHEELKPEAHREGDNVDGGGEPLGV